MARLLGIIALVWVASIAHAQKATPEKKPITAAEQCSRSCGKLCFAADPLCINKCQSRCAKTGLIKR